MPPPVETPRDLINESLWPQYFAWLKQRLETMYKVFAPIVKNLKPEIERVD